LKNFRQFALTYPGLAKNENLSAFLPVLSLTVSNLPIRQTVSAEFKTIPQNLFPPLEVREQQQPSLSWQDNGYYLKENVTYSHENPPVGILLCAEKDAEAVYYATAGLGNQLFVSRYLVALPSEETFKKWLKEEQDRLEQQFDFDSRREK
jgi:hypothetical protein